MSGLVTWAVAVAGVLLARRLLGHRTSEGGWLAAAVLGPAVGFGALSLFFFCWRLCGLSSGQFRFHAWALIIGIIGWGARETFHSTATRGSSAQRDSQAAEQGSPLSLGLLLSAAALLAAALVLYARQIPHGSFDAWSIWTSRARLLYLGEDLPTLFGLLRKGHPDYPLLLPGSLAAQFALAGNASARISQWTGAFFAFAAAGAVALSVIRLGGGRRWALLAAALLLTTPSFISWGAAQGADVPFGYLWVVALVALATLLDNTRPLAPPMLAGFVLGLLAWTKNEGLPLTALLVVLFVAAAIVRGKRSLLLPVFLGALPPWIAVVLFRWLWQPRTDLGFFAGDLVSRLVVPARWHAVASGFGDRLLPWRGFADWSLVWLLAALVLAVVFALRRSPTPALRAARWALACCWLAWFGVFVGTPLDLDWHLRTALDRLLLQLLPLTLTVAFAGLTTGKQPPAASA